MGVSVIACKYLVDGYSVIRLFDYSLIVEKLRSLECSLTLAAESGERREVLTAFAGIGHRA